MRWAPSDLSYLASTLLLGQRPKIEHEIDVSGYVNVMNTCRS